MKDVLFQPESSGRRVAQFYVPAGGTQRSWKNGGRFTRPSWNGTLCADEMFTKSPLNSAAGLQWGALPSVSAIRKMAYRHFSIIVPPMRHDLAQVVLYTRLDSSKRQLVVPPGEREAVRQRLGVTQWVDHIPGPVKDQVQLLASASVVITGACHFPCPSPCPSKSG